MPPSFFERQIGLNCAVHSINNYFQEEIIPCSSMDVVRYWIRQNYTANRNGTYEEYFRADGFFSIPTLLNYVSQNFGNTVPQIQGSIGVISRDQTLAILRDNTRIISSRNRRCYRHSVTAIKEGNYWYLLDSEDTGPSRGLSAENLLNRLTSFIYAENRPKELPATSTDEVVEIESKLNISSLHRSVR